MPYYTNAGVRLHYVRRGAASSPPPTAVVFQHGIGRDVRQASRFLAPERTSVPEGELGIVHADFRAHGQSELGRAEHLSIRTLASDLAALLDHLELDQAIVGGTCVGAAAALRFAMEEPERCRALILCRPAWASGTMNAVARHALGLVAELLAADDWQRSAAPLLERNGILRYVKAVCPDAVRTLRGHVQAVLARPETREAAIARLRELPRSRGVDDLGELASVSCPTLILSAQSDPLHPFECARELALAMPNSQLVRISRTCPLDASAHLEEVDRAIGEFLRAVLDGGDRDGPPDPSRRPLVHAGGDG